MILQNLGQILPRRMKYFYLSLKYIEIRDLKVFFKNSQDIHFKKLSINNAKDEECRDIFPCIKKHIIKMKRVEFFSFSEHHRELIDLFDQKDEVKEFEQHGIRVLNHNCLYLTIFEYLDDDIE
ncbi:hypothetical protein GLOIN_2v1784343 [Rhizophagus clarus]|nr:hypothetical protein GLOIN_2v1784343 [Rhizophagus clarus]